MPTKHLNYQIPLSRYNELKTHYHQFIQTNNYKEKKGLIHPLAFIEALSKYRCEHTIFACDIGSVYMWMARYFLSYIPHQLLFSNGQQTLGVALPWAIAAKIAYPDKQIISISGDGGFLFSSMELETAVRLKKHFIHFVWVDHSYNMVKEQELLKYKRKSAVDFGPIDLICYAEAFGAKGFKLTDIKDFSKIMDEALQSTLPVLIEVPIDYSDNPKLFSQIDSNLGN